MKRVTIFGGSGFIGRSVTKHLIEQETQVRIAARASGQKSSDSNIECVRTNICKPVDVQEAVKDASVVVNLVGTFDAFGPNNFQAIHVEAAERIAKAAKAAGVQRLVHLSSIGADENSYSEYSRTKALGERAVLQAFPKATILRPSVVFGAEDQFFNRFSDMVRFNPILPLVGGKTKFQPVYVGDVAKAIETACLETRPGIYELGGPESADFQTLMKKMLKVTDRKRLIMEMPHAVSNLMGGCFDTLSRITNGRFQNRILTQDQIRSLGHDNVVGYEARGFAELGISPRSIDEILPTYLGPKKRE